MSKQDRRKNAVNRRDFVASAVAAVALTGYASREGQAQELPKLAEDDPTAQALKYVHDATTVDASVRPEGRFCNNCALYAGDADAAWAACSIFPGKAVANGGWCSVWAPRAPG